KSQLFLLLVMDCRCCQRSFIESKSQQGPAHKAAKMVVKDRSLKANHNAMVDWISASGVVKDRSLKANHNYEFAITEINNVVKDRSLKANHNLARPGAPQPIVVKDRSLKANHNHVTLIVHRMLVV